MNYLKSEHLKYKRTAANKLLFLAPFITAFFAWMAGGFIGFQYMGFYWWYTFLLPGTIAILCALSHRKEVNAGNYTSVFSFPISLFQFEAAKGIVLIEKLLASAIILALLLSISNFIAPATVVYSVSQTLTGSIGIILASVWQIPICLYLARRTGLFLPVILNTVLGVFMPLAFGNTGIWWLIPHCYAAKLAEPLMGIALNGTFSQNPKEPAVIFISIVLSLLLFVVLSFGDANDFSKRRLSK